MSLRSVVPLALFVASSVGLSTVGLATSSASTSKSSTRTFKNIIFGISDQQDIGFPEVYKNADFKALRFQKTRVIISWDAISTSGLTGPTVLSLRESCQQAWDNSKRPMVSIVNSPLSDADWRSAFKLVDICNTPDPKKSFRGYADIEIANEPDNSSAAMTPTQAVQGLKVARSLYGSKARISPFALSVSASATSTNWQTSWINAWKLANYPAIDAISYHPYGDSNSGTSSLVPLVTSFANKWNHLTKSKRGGIPEVWLTEFSVLHSYQESCVNTIEPAPSNFSSMSAEQQQADQQRRIDNQHNDARQKDGTSVIDDDAGRFWVIPDAFKLMKSRSKVEEKLAVASQYMCYRMSSNITHDARVAAQKKHHILKQYFTLQAPNSSVESSKATRYVKMVNYWANLKWPGSKTKWLHRVYWYEWANARCTRANSPFFRPIGDATTVGSMSPSAPPTSKEEDYTANSGGCGDDHHAAWQSGLYGYSNNSSNHSQYFEPSPIIGIIKAARG